MPLTRQAGEFRISTCSCVTSQHLPDRCAILVKMHVCTSDAPRMYVFGVECLLSHSPIALLFSSRIEIHGPPFPFGQFSACTVSIQVRTPPSHHVGEFGAVSTYAQHVLPIFHASAWDPHQPHMPCTEPHVYFLHMEVPTCG